ncbi:MAG TPA: hypothetical protein VLG92_02955 [Candidatus Saccharimonadia bacterium]|nr:hypothetical protein [Candidatus Saccharimonadia bacterium]
MVTEAALTPQNIPEYVRGQIPLVAELARHSSNGEALGVLACTIIAIDGNVASGRAFAEEQIALGHTVAKPLWPVDAEGVVAEGRAEIISREDFPAYEQADIWKWLGWKGDEEARDKAWELLDDAVLAVRRSYSEKGLFDQITQDEAAQTAAVAYSLVRGYDNRPESLQRARDIAALAAEAGSPQHLALLYDQGDDESFNREIEIFDTQIQQATSEAGEEKIRFEHSYTLYDLALKAVARDNFDQATQAMDRLTDDSLKVSIHAALFGKDPTGPLPPFIENFLSRTDLRGGWTPSVTRALAIAQYSPAIERLRVSTEGRREMQLHALLDAGVEGAREQLLACVADPEKGAVGLCSELDDLTKHGLKEEALQIAKERYAEKDEASIAYWIWMHEATPDITLWPRAYAGAHEHRGIRAAYALHKLARLATQATAEA